MSSNFMPLALVEARIAAQLEEIPVGAIIVDSSGKIIARAHNLTERENDPTAHAELLAIRQACAAISSPRLIDCDMIVTLEPCAMCAAAISFARIRRLYFAAYDPKGGGVEHGARIFHQSTCYHRPEIIGGIMESESAALLKDFFQKRRL